MPGLKGKSAAALYALWIALCAVALLALRGAEDPARRTDRILSSDAARMAVSELRRRDPLQYRDFEAVHVAWAARREGEPRWIVLCDRVPHTALRQAVVVELRARDGALAGIRKPVD